MKKVLVVLSGGMDSTTLLYTLLADLSRENVFAIGFNYGQRHARELEYATRHCAKLSVRYDVVDLRLLAPLLEGNALTDPAHVVVPHGHYADETMKKTVVPNRNAIMLNIAAAVASSRGVDTIATAIHAGDHAIYPDCRPEFEHALNALLRVALDGLEPVQVIAPFISISKTKIAALGETQDVDWSLTWSCYEGGEKHCGRCGTCVERKEAFRESFVHDPTEYVT